MVNINIMKNRKNFISTFRKKFLNPPNSNLNEKADPKRVRIVAFVIVIIFLLLTLRIFYLQFIKGSELKELAYKQQTINRIISPKRGIIYDSTGIPLAISSQVDTVTINPKQITDKDPEKAKQKKELIAKRLI